KVEGPDAGPGGASAEVGAGRNHVDGGEGDRPDGVPRGSEQDRQSLTRQGLAREARRREIPAAVKLVRPLYNKDWQRPAPLHGGAGGFHYSSLRQRTNWP